MGVPPQAEVTTTALTSNLGPYIRRNCVPTGLTRTFPAGIPFRGLSAAVHGRWATRRRTSSPWRWVSVLSKTCCTWVRIVS
jgi:hypothetical protein